MKMYVLLPAFLLFSLFSTLVAAKDVIDPSQVKYLIRDIEGDITQRTSRYYSRYSSVSEMEKLVRYYLEKSLNEKGLLASKAAPYVITLDLFVDYRRRFFGDETPMPSPKLAAPNIRIHTTLSAGESVIRQSISKELTGGLIRQFFSQDEPRLTQELKYYAGIANWIANSLLEHKADDIEAFLAVTGNEGNTRQYSAQSVLSAYTKRKQAEPLPVLGLDYEEYIPSGVIASYLKGVNSRTQTTRIATYKELSKVWINSPAIFDALQERLLAAHGRYDSETKENKNEIVWLMKGLASSGMKQYRPMLESLASNAPSKHIQSRAEKYLVYFDDRQASAEIIHNIFTMSPNESWPVNQLANMLNSGDAKLGKNAIAVIAREHKDNQYLLDAMAQRLQKESMRKSYRSISAEGSYAWFCRILGESGKRRYKPLLEALSTQAHSKKVRKFAKKYAKVLG